MNGAIAQGKAGDPEIPEAKRMTIRPMLEAIVRVTAEHFGVSPEGLFRDGRGNLPRAIPIPISRSPGVYPLKEIAQVFKVGAYSSISVAALQSLGRSETVMHVPSSNPKLTS